LDKRAALSLLLIVVAFGVGGVVASGIGADRSAKRPDSFVPPTPTGRSLETIATPEELKLWNDRSCFMCHGPAGKGTQMGPDLTKVVPIYLAKHGSADAAKKALVAYLIDPKGSPKLRDDGATFPNPMPPIEKLVGGRREDADVLAGLLVRLGE